MCKGGAPNFGRLFEHLPGIPGRIVEAADRVDSSLASLLQHPMVPSEWTQHSGGGSVKIQIQLDAQTPFQAPIHSPASPLFSGKAPFPTPVVFERKPLAYGPTVQAVI